MSTRHGDREISANYVPALPMVGGEAVPIDLRVARIGSRAVAAILDFGLQLFAIGFLIAMLANLANLDTAALRALAVTALVLVFIGYPVVMEAAWGGRTLGKAAMGLRAARDDGGPLRFRHALVRGLVGVFVEKPGISLGFVAVLCSLSSTRGKRCGDLLAGTVVLQVRLPTAGGYLAPMPPPLAGWATTLDLSLFNDSVALVCRQFLGRAGQLSGAARERLGASLVASVQAVVAPPPPPGTPGWAYLTAVLAERRRREEMRTNASAQPGHPDYFGCPGPAPVGQHQPPAVPPAPGRAPSPGPFAPPG